MLYLRPSAISAVKWFGEAFGWGGRRGGGQILGIEKILHHDGHAVQLRAGALCLALCVERAPPPGARVEGDRVEARTLPIGLPGNGPVSGADLRRRLAGVTTLR